MSGIDPRAHHAIVARERRAARAAEEHALRTRNRDQPVTQVIDTYLRKKQRLSEMSLWLADQEFWPAQRVADHLSISRDKVDDIPREVLPWTDITPGSKRRTKRFRPTDVFAYPAVSRAWGAAIEEDREEEFLAERRAQLEERDRRLQALALGKQLEGTTDAADEDMQPDIEEAA